MFEDTFVRCNDNGGITMNVTSLEYPEQHGPCIIAVVRETPNSDPLSNEILTNIINPVTDFQPILYPNSLV